MDNNNNYNLISSIIEILNDFSESLLNLSAGLKEVKEVLKGVEKKMQLETKCN